MLEYGSMDWKDFGKCNGPVIAISTIVFRRLEEALNSYVCDEGGVFRTDFAEEGSEGVTTHKWLVHRLVTKHLRNCVG